ncbi:MAG: TonB-dependent receptor, partial [Chitinivibrionales bacterium]|nr:TonB-dependent receptor [Chitinivibrionales bacterium]MBD3355975.1 TonB-dependent receptor [Chitinivibrionales bacterium]
QNIVYSSDQLNYFSDKNSATTMALSPRVTMNLNEANSVEARFDYTLIRTMSEEFRALTIHGEKLKKEVPGFNFFPPRDEQRSQSEIVLQPQLLFKTESIPYNKLAVGVNFSRRNFLDSDSTHLFNFMRTTEEAQKPQAGKHKWLEVAAFAETMMEFDRLSILAGARFDRVQHDPLEITISEKEETFDIAASQNIAPRLAVSFSITDNHTIRTSYQQTFRYPDLNYLTARVPFQTYLKEHLSVTLEDLKNETVHSMEAGVNGTITPLNLEYKATAFGNRYDDLMGWERPNVLFSDNPWLEDTLLSRRKAKGEDYRMIRPGGTFDNAEETFWAVGGEIGLTYTFPNDMTTIESNYSYTRPVASTDTLNTSCIYDGDELRWSSYPAHLVKLNFIQKLADERITVSINPYYHSPIEGKPGEEDDLKYELNRHQIRLNGKIVASINDHFALNVSGTNLLGSRVPEPVYDMGATYSGGLASDITKVYAGVELKW